LRSRVGGAFQSRFFNHILRSRVGGALHSTPTLTPITPKSVYRPHNHTIEIADRWRISISLCGLHISISLWSLNLSNGSRFSTIAFFLVWFLSKYGNAYAITAGETKMCKFGQNICFKISLKIYFLRFLSSELAVIYLNKMKQAERAS